MKTWRLAIGLMYVFCFVIETLLAFKVYGHAEINAEDLIPLLTKLFAIYSIPLGVIVGGVFASKGSTRRAAGPEIWGVFVLSIVWNGLLLVRYIIFAFGKQDSVLQLGAFLDVVSTAGGFLISGALAYLYGRNSS